MAQFRKMQRDVEKLRRLNTSYRRKARRVKKLYDVNLDYNVLYIADFTSRKQFNDYVKKMEKVTAYSEHRYVKNKYGMVVKREVYQDYIKTIDKAQKIAEKEREQLLKLLEKKLGHRPDLENLRLMGDNRYERFNISYKFDNYGDVGYFEDHLETMKRKQNPKYYRQSDLRLKNNFLSAIDTSLGAVGKPLYKMISDMSVSDFILFYYSTDSADFGYVYSFEESVTIVNTLITDVNRFYKILGD